MEMELYIPGSWEFVSHMVFEVFFILFGFFLAGIWNGQGFSLMGFSPCNGDFTRLL